MLHPVCLYSLSGVAIHMATNQWLKSTKFILSQFFKPEVSNIKVPAWLALLEVLGKNPFYTFLPWFLVVADHPGGPWFGAA